jgi:hypothetical protein
MRTAEFEVAVKRFLTALQEGDGIEGVCNGCSRVV